ncbi:MAG: SGNH/GDSL hydrolase family protein [Myxococcota bacterium]
MTNPAPTDLARVCRQAAAHTRRQWLAGAATLAATGLARADDPPVDGSAALPRILLAGDSMIAGGLGIYLEKDLGKKGLGYPVLRAGKTSSGLSRPDFFNWMKEAKRLADEFEPQATVVMFGGNDVQGLYMGRHREPGTPLWIRFPEEPAWSEEYARRVSEFCDIIAPNDEPIFWIGMPVMRPPTFHEKIKRVNVIYRAEMAIRPNATFIDIWDMLSDGSGGYAHKIERPPAAEGEKPKKVRVRAGDGIHLSPAGARIVADHAKAIVTTALATEAAK